MTKLPIAALAALLAATAILASCAPRTHSTAGAAAPEPRASACEEPLYLRLRAAEPDGLTEREWARLQHLEELCLLERRATATDARETPSIHRRGGLTDAHWLWMPGMMLFGGLMWLMMDG